MDTPLESEIKLKCDDVEALVEAHPDLGWTVVSERHFEDNFVFELPESALERRGSILRLRIAEGTATLTYKGLVPESAASDMKVREELETHVDRPEMLVEIFERLGLKRSFRYQKYRTVYRLKLDGEAVELMRDELPFGGFIEIEGEPETIAAVAERLGFSQSDSIRESYIGIQAAMCRARGVPLQDLVF